MTADGDFLVRVDGERTTFAARSDAAEDWLRESGRVAADAPRPAVIEREGPGASIFLEALIRKGFVCRYEDGATVERKVDPPRSATPALFGCGTIAALLVIAPLIYFTKRDPDAGPGASSAATGSQPPPPSCSLPECVDPAIYARVTAGMSDGDLLQVREVGEAQLYNLAYGLPAPKLKGEYEPTAAYKARLPANNNSWSLGDFKPSTMLLARSEPLSYTTYNPDTETLDTGKPERPISATIGDIESSDTTTPSEEDNPLTVRQNTSRSTNLFFVNMKPLRYKRPNDGCSINYEHSTSSNNIRLGIAPAEAQRVQGKLSINYVFSFTAPSSSTKKGWCHIGADSRSTNMLTPGGIYHNETRTSYINVHLNRLFVSDGKRILWSKSFD